MADLADQEQDIRHVRRSLENQLFYADIVNKYQAKILSFIRRISGVSQEEAEDIAQEIFLKAYVNLNNFDQDKKFFSWLFSIAHNEVVSHWRKNKKRLKDVSIEGEELAERLGKENNLVEEIDLKVEKTELKNAINKLNFKYREVLELKFIEDYSYQEISDIVKKPVATVGTLINRAKKQLKEIMK